MSIRHDPGPTPGQGPTGQSTTGQSTTGQNTTGQNTTDTAKEQAGGVAASASEKAGQVAETSKQQAGEVVGEAKRQARDLAGEARSQVDEQARSQRDRLSGTLRSVGDDLDSMLQGQGGTDGLAGEVARQVSEQARRAASYLESHEPTDLLAEVRSFARQRPGAFLLGALAAGVVAGRVTRGAKSASSSGPSQQRTRSYDAPAVGTSATPDPYAGTGGMPTPPPLQGTAAFPAASSHGRDALGERTPTAGPLSPEVAGDRDLAGGTRGDATRGLAP